MSDDQTPYRGPERPRHEPEIIPPGQGDRLRRGGAEFWTFRDGGGFQRVYVARPGLPTIIFVLLLIGLFAAIAFLVIAGIVLFWIPILIGGILIALVTGVARYKWRQFQAWWAGR